MPSVASKPSDHPLAIAPDGIAIHTFALPSAAFVGVAEGRIPPGRYAIHRHLTIEQYTYVVSGRLTAIVGTEDEPQGRPVLLEDGTLMLTSPGESLEFANAGPEEARVLFICAPPYPADDSDTHVIESHASPSVEAADAARRRLEELQRTVNAEINARRTALIRQSGAADRR